MKPCGGVRQVLADFPSANTAMDAFHNEPVRELDEDPVQVLWRLENEARRMPGLGATERRRCPSVR